MSSREEGVAGAPSVPPGPVGVGGVLVSQLFSPFTELVFTLGGPSGSCLMGGGLARSPPSPSSLVRPGPREVREAFASAATVLFSFFIVFYLPGVTGSLPLQPSQLVPIDSEIIRMCEHVCVMLELYLFWFRLPRMNWSVTFPPALFYLYFRRQKNVLQLTQIFICDDF